MNMLNKHIQSLKRLRYGVAIDPMRDWFVALIIFIIALIGTIVWSIQSFSTVAGGGTIGIVTKEVQPIFNKSSLDDIHAVFTSRADEESKYVSGIYNYTDPSQ